MKLTYIEKDNKYKNINEILIKEFNISNRLRTKLIKNNCITLNKKYVDTRNTVNIGDIITIDFSYAENNINIIPKEMNLDILYEDEWFIVINKPAYIAIHPSYLHYSNSLSNGVKYYFDKINLHKKIRPVNRLDLNTSGIVIFAKCEYIQEQFSNQMMQNIFKKEYLCVIEGSLKNESGTINLPISRKSNSIIERCINQNGKTSITHYEVLEKFSNYSIVKCKLETGRTHQIRVHFSYIGHPIIGDSLYGSKTNLINRQALHSSKIELFHPILKRKMIFESKLPQDIENLISSL